MSPFTLRLRLARSPGTRRSLGGGGWRRSGDIYVLFLSNFVSPGQSRSRPTIWDFEAERRWAPRALMVITCPQACGGRAVEASSCALRDLRGTRTAWVTSTLILNTMQLAEQLFFLSLFFSELDTLSFFLAGFLNSFLEHLRFQPDFSSSSSFFFWQSKVIQMNPCQWKSRCIFSHFHRDGVTAALRLYFALIAQWILVFYLMATYIFLFLFDIFGLFFLHDVLSPHFSLVFLMISFLCSVYLICPTPVCLTWFFFCLMMVPEKQFNRRF